MLKRRGPLRLPHRHDPVLRAIVRRERDRLSRSYRWISGGVGWAVLVALLYLGYRIYREGHLIGLRANGASPAFITAYVPLLIFQFSVVASGLTAAAALCLTSPLVPLTEHLRTWEGVKATPAGARLLIRARWLGVFYHMAGALTALLLLRLVFALQAVASLLSGRFMHLPGWSQASPALPPGWAALLAGTAILAALMQPLALLSLNAAFSVWLSGYVRRRTLLQSLLMFVIFAQFIVGAWSLLAGTVVLAPQADVPTYMAMSPQTRWLRLLLLGTTGDLGLRYLNIGSLVASWRQPYAMWIGPALLLIVLAEMLLTAFLLRLAVRRAALPLRR